MSIKINTQAVIETAIKLERDNKGIFDEFANAKTAVADLTNSWQGAAATASISAFNRIESSFRQARYDSMNGFVRFLREHVSESYEQTEETLDNAAKAFK